MLHTHTSLTLLSPSAIGPVSETPSLSLWVIYSIFQGSTESQLMPRQVEEFLNSRGWKTPKETSEPLPFPSSSYSVSYPCITIKLTYFSFHLVLQAFDLFLKPDSKHSGTTNPPLPLSLRDVFWNTLSRSISGSSRGSRRTLQIPNIMYVVRR